MKHGNGVSPHICKLEGRGEHGRALEQDPILGLAPCICIVSNTSFCMHLFGEQASFSMVGAFLC